MDRNILHSLIIIAVVLYVKYVSTENCYTCRPVDSTSLICWGYLPSLAKQCRKVYPDVRIIYLNWNTLPLDDNNMSGILLGFDKLSEIYMLEKPVIFRNTSGVDQIDKNNLNDYLKYKFVGPLGLINIFLHVGLLSDCCILWKVFSLLDEVRNELFQNHTARCLDNIKLHCRLKFLNNFTDIKTWFRNSTQLNYLNKSKRNIVLRKKRQTAKWRMYETYVYPVLGESTDGSYGGGITPKGLKMPQMKKRSRKKSLKVGQPKESDKGISEKEKTKQEIIKIKLTKTESVGITKNKTGPQTVAENNKNKPGAEGSLGNKTTKDNLANKTTKVVSTASTTSKEHLVFFEFNPKMHTYSDEDFYLDSNGNPIQPRSHWKRFNGTTRIKILRKIIAKIPFSNDYQNLILYQIFALTALFLLLFSLFQIIIYCIEIRSLRFAPYGSQTPRLLSQSTKIHWEDEDILLGRSGGDTSRKVEHSEPESAESAEDIEKKSKRKSDRRHHVYFGLEKSNPEETANIKGFDQLTDLNNVNNINNIDEFIKENGGDGDGGDDANDMNISNSINIVAEFANEPDNINLIDDSVDMIDLNHTPEFNAEGDNINEINDVNEVSNNFNQLSIL